MYGAREGSRMPLAGEDRDMVNGEAGKGELAFNCAARARNGYR